MIWIYKEFSAEIIVTGSHEKEDSYHFFIGVLPANNYAGNSNLALNPLRQTHP